MDKNTSYVLVLFKATFAVVTVLYMLLAQGSTKGQTLDAMTKSFNRAKTPSQKIFAAAASFGLLLNAGA
jgi:hypothetical protein